MAGFGAEQGYLKAHLARFAPLNGDIFGLPLFPVQVYGRPIYGLASRSIKNWLPANVVSTKRLRWTGRETMDIASEKNGTRTDVQPALTEDDRWYQDYLRWRRARLRLVQASARVWLSVLTTLLGLLGSVVLFKGGALVTGVTSSGWWQAVLIVLVGSVFAAAVLAVVVGGVATWGGLEDIPPDGLGSPPQVLPAYKTRRWGKILFRVVLKLAMIPPDDRKKALEVFEGKDVRQNQDPEFAWQRYRADIVDNADRNRVYLHASRVLGVFAAVFIAALAIAAVFAGTIAPAPADVIVVHNGRLACGPFSASAKDTEVTQVVPVTSC